jgi:hypothetical protein
MQDGGYDFTIVEIHLATIAFDIKAFGISVGIFRERLESLTLAGLIYHFVLRFKHLEPLVLRTANIQGIWIKMTEWQGDLRFKKYRFKIFVESLMYDFVMSDLGWEAGICGQQQTRPPSALPTNDSLLSTLQQLNNLPFIV